MAKSDNVLGVAQIEIGAPGDGIMGASLTAFTNVELNSLSFSGAVSNETTIATESNDSYLTLSEAATPPQGSFRLYEVFGDDLVLLMGGSYDVPTTTYKAPNSVPDLYRSIRITSNTLDGAFFQIEIPYARISARPDGNISKGTIMAIQVDFIANTPVSAAQVEGDVYSIIKN